MKNTIIFFLFLLLKAPVFSQDSLLLKKDAENINNSIFQLLQQIPKEEIKKINEETFLVSVYVKDSAIKSFDVFTKPNSILELTVRKLLIQMLIGHKLFYSQEKHLLFSVSINNSSKRIENRPKQNSATSSDFGKLNSVLANYGLLSSISVYISADKKIK